MRSIKRYIADIAGLLLVVFAFFVYAAGSGRLPSKPPAPPGLQEYKGPESSVYELNADAPADKIALIFPAVKRVITNTPGPKPAAGKPLRDSTYLAYVSRSVLDNGKTVYMFVDNTIMRIYTLATGESNGGLTLKEIGNGYFLIETPDSIERVSAQK
ncbi:MAG: hypothetical protein JW874_09085 [Spirochaetales bacterium]|nr:hypothetical protein [Spirochaetales bacterium]